MTISLYAIEVKNHHLPPRSGCFRKCIDYFSIRNRSKKSPSTTSGGVLQKMNLLGFTEKSGVAELRDEYNW
ncbi:MAG: hypothetical protein QNJ68_10495 [Microcoleaceae cyanobacterium MO_207.B10]|nr:hypothetical protein [Microcoleaceae cyanobacterium MO_207.B10]